MKPSFKDTFLNDKESKYRMSKSLIDSLNENAPDDTQYKLTKNGTLVLIPKKGKKMSFSGLRIVNPPEAKKIQKEYGNEAVFDFSYNSQMSIELKPINNEMKINGKKTKFDELIIDFSESCVDKSNNRLILSPPAFNNPRIIELSDKRTKYKVELNRIPNKSIEEEIYESSNNKPLSLKIILNRSKKLTSYSLTIDLKKTTSVKEIVDVFSLYDAFIKNGLYINNNFRITSNQDNETNFNEVSLLFWKKVLRVEKAISKKFKVDANKLNDKLIFNIEYLYQNLVKKKPVRKNTYITKMSIKDFDADVLKDLKDKSVGFDFCDIDEINLFDKKIKLYTIYNVIYVKPSIINKEENEVEIKFEPDEKLSAPYTSFLSFLTEKEMNEYFKNNLNNNRDKFQKAKTLVEYIDESMNEQTKNK